MALSENYKRALTALKDQAEAIRDGIQADNGDKDRLAAKSALRDAQRRLTEVAEETKHIVRLILNPDVRGITIPNMTEVDLERLLNLEGANRSHTEKDEISDRITGLNWRAYHAVKLH